VPYTQDWFTAIVLADIFHVYLDCNPGIRRNCELKGRRQALYARVL